MHILKSILLFESPELKALQRGLASALEGLGHSLARLTSTLQYLDTSNTRNFALCSPEIGHLQGTLASKNIRDNLDVILALDVNQYTVKDETTPASVLYEYIQAWHENLHCAADEAVHGLGRRNGTNLDLNNHSNHATPL
jgi:hypothetical protein